MSELRKEIYEIIEDICEYEGLCDNPDTELLESNILDSLSFILLLNRIDDELDIELQPTQIDPAVFRTPASIADYIENAEQ